MTQRHLPTRGRGTAVERGKKKKKKNPKGAAEETPRDTPHGGESGLTDESLQEELERVVEALEGESQYADLMKATAELALRALDSSLVDGKWSTCVTPPSGTRPSETFQWSDKAQGINATNVTVPRDWTGGPVLVRLHRTPVAPRLPAPSTDVKQRPLRATLHDTHTPLVGIAETRPVQFSAEWKQVFKGAGVRKEDLTDPVKAARIQLALAESWDASAAMPELQGFTDILGPLANLALGPKDKAEASPEAMAAAAATAAAVAEAVGGEVPAPPPLAPPPLAPPTMVSPALGAPPIAANGVEPPPPPPPTTTTPPPPAAAVNPMASIAAQLVGGRAALKAVKRSAPPPEADGMAGALDQIKAGAFKLRSAPPPCASGGKGGSARAGVTLSSDVVAELNANQAIKGVGNGRFGLKKTGMRSQSGRMLPPSAADSERRAQPGNATNPAAELNFRAGLRKTKPRPPPPQELSELDKIREKIAQKMKARLAEMEEQDVAASWEDQPQQEGGVDPLGDEAFGGPGRV